MRALLKKRDALAVLPTGGGKSAIYQVPATLLAGPTIVISPLLALQQDQIAGLNGRGDVRLTAVRVSSAETPNQQRAALQALREGTARFLFITPEQLGNPERLAEVRALRPSLVAVDEAHCVSTWGYDFRPDYLQLGHLIRELGRPPVVALTATASPPVRADITATLGLRDPFTLVAGLDRANLALAAVRCTSDEQRWQRLLAQVRQSRRRASSMRRRGRPPSTTRPGSPRTASRRSPSTPGWPRASATAATPTSWPTGSRSWSPPAPSAWASTSPTSGGCTTWRCPTPRTATCRRSAAPDATAHRPARSSTSAPRTSRCSGSSRPARPTPRS
jgi:hypothetical protein